MSYCGLTGGLKSSAGKQQRGPISKQRNQAAKHADRSRQAGTRWNPQLPRCMPANWNADIATVPRCVARKTRHLSAGLDKSGQSFQLRALDPTTKREEGRDTKKSKPPKKEKL